jgi:[ribosomal protein S5]-alanine N-acetyltransferase
MVQVQFPDLWLLAFLDRYFSTLELDRVYFHQDHGVIQLLFIVLVYDITAFRHSLIYFAFVMYSDMPVLNIPEKIETNRLLLQRLRYEDAEEIFYTYASKPEATRYLAWPTHKTIEDTRAFLRYAIESWHMGTDYSFSIRLKNTHQLIGSFGAIHEDGKIQFGYVLSPTVWGQGYATEVCKKMMDTLNTIPSLYRIGTFVDIENEASLKVLLNSGLVEEGRMKKWFRFINQNNEPKDCAVFRLPSNAK